MKITYTVSDRKVGNVIGIGSDKDITVIVKCSQCRRKCRLISEFPLSKWWCIKHGEQATLRKP